MAVWKAFLFACAAGAAVLKASGTANCYWALPVAILTFVVVLWIYSKGKKYEER